MEPLAPGTEDEPLYSGAPVIKQSKQDQEVERALSLQSYLPNGTYGKVYDLDYKQGAQHWFCNVCDCPIMGRIFNHEIGKRHTLNLQANKKSAGMAGGKRLSASNPPPPGMEDITDLRVAPGEPAPPGFEGPSEGVTSIQERLNGFNAGPLVALEYLLELQDYDTSKEPSYLCILCDKKGDPRTVLTHLSSYNHITTYLQKHFPTCYRALAPFMTKQYKRNWQSVLQKIAEAIEATFGRLIPIPVEADKFEKNRMHYLEIVAKGNHFSELGGMTFEHMIVKEELTRSHEEEPKYDAKLPFRKLAYDMQQKRKSPSPPVVARPFKRNRNYPNDNRPEIRGRSDGRKRRSLSPVSDASSSDLEEFDPRRKDSAKVVVKPPPFRKNFPPQPRRDDPMNRRGGFNGKGVYSRRGAPSPSRRSPPPFRRSSPPARRSSPPPSRRSPLPIPRRASPPNKRSPSPARGNLPWQKPNYGRNKPLLDKRQQDEKTAKLEEYKKLAKAIENDTDKTLKQQKQNPEKHPQYNDEWKKFWNRRYKELKDEGKDAANHDFKPEWIEFWNKKMIEIHQEDVRVKKAALRRRLGLPEEPAPIRFKIGDKKKPGERSPSRSSNKPVPTAAQPDNDPEVIIIDDKDDRRDPTPKRSRSRSGSHSPWEDSPPKVTIKPTPKVQPRPAPTKRPSPPRRPSPSPERERERRISPRRSRSRSRERIVIREKVRPRETDTRKERRSPVYERERDRFGRDLVRSRERSRERSWERERSHDRSRDYHEIPPWEKSYRQMPRVRTTQDLPWERDPYMHEIPDIYKPPKVMRDVSRVPIMSPRDMASPEPEDDGEVNIVGVLRILTALEEKLGSLGPKVIDLLAQALAMEKKEANSSENLLESEINCVLFETVKEKLKGQMLANLVERHQERAFKIAIKKTAALIYVAGERKRENEKKKPKVDPVIVPGIGTVDKSAIAKQIANALILQGKTDVTQAELEQLINAVVGMAEASKRSSQPVTTATFLEKIANSPAPAPEPPTTIASLFSTLNALKEMAPTPQATNNSKSISTENTKYNPLTLEIKNTTDDTIDMINDSSSSLPSPTIEKMMVTNMESLSDSDLQALLQNFKDLNTDEQHSLITYLKKLEAKEPERVEHLRKFVNLKGDNLNTSGTDKDKEDGRESPFSNRLSVNNPAPQPITDDISDFQTKKQFDEPKHSSTEPIVSNAKMIDSEDEDYSFEDVAKAASQNVKEKELEQKLKEEKDAPKKKDDINLNDAKALITNIMNNLNKHNAPKASPPTSGGGGKVNIISNVSVNPIDLEKTLSSLPINMSNLGSILGNIQNLTKQKEASQNPSNKYNEFNIEGNSLDKPDAKKEPQSNKYDVFSIGPNPGAEGGPDRFERAPVFEPNRTQGFDANRGNFERPSLDQNRPNFDMNRPNFDLSRPNFDQRLNAPPVNRPYDSNRPSFEPNRPNMDWNRPNFEPNRPGFDSNRSNFDAGRSGFEPNRPNFDLGRPNFEPNSFDNRGTSFDNKNPAMERRLNFEPPSRGPAYPPKESNVKYPLLGQNSMPPKSSFGPDSIQYPLRNQSMGFGPPSYGGGMNSSNFGGNTGGVNKGNFRGTGGQLPPQQGSNFGPGGFNQGNNRNFGGPPGDKPGFNNNKRYGGGGNYYN